MEQVKIWYCTDNEHGREIAEAVRSMGLPVTMVEGGEIRSINADSREINLFIIDIEGEKPAELLSGIEKHPVMAASQKFFLFRKREIQEIQKGPVNLSHVELISKPVDRREFLLLLEKSVIVERYRELMRYISLEAEERIEVFEELMDINRKDIFADDKEKKAFEKIVSYEKGLMREQVKLNEAIKEFTLLRQNELLDMQSRIQAEEMLADLRRREMIDARQIIEAQESVIDFSSFKLDEAKKILDASEQVAELSRVEAIQLHQDLARERELNRTLTEKVTALAKEVDELRKKNKN